MNGQRESANGFLLNGTTVQEFAFSGTAIIPNLDSIAEFRILTNNFDAEYGNYSGGQINVVTKSGSNQFHGSALRVPAQHGPGCQELILPRQRDDYKQNQFGGTIGGPIKHDSLFFFGDYQGNRVVIGQSALGKIAVPTDAERTGDFSSAGARRNADRRCAGSFLGPAALNQCRLYRHPGRALLLSRLHLGAVRFSRRADSRQPVYRSLNEYAEVHSPGQYDRCQRKCVLHPSERSHNSSRMTRPAAGIDYNALIGLIERLLFLRSIQPDCS